MQSKHTVESTTIWRADDPNYPGVPQPPPEVVARSTSRANVDYDTYVLRFSRELRFNTLLMSIAVVMIIGAAVYLSGVALIIIAAVGIGIGLAGVVGFMATDAAHRSYTENLAVSVSETYERPAAASPPQTVRPFVSSANSDGRTTNTGRLSFEPRVWQSLFDLALANAGVIDKENVCRRAGIGRRWYHTDPNSADGYRAFLAELRQLRFIDDRNRLTDLALQWYEQQIPLPLATLPSRTPVDRPTADRPPTDRAQRAGWGE